MQCSEDDCERDVLARGLCSRHYSAWQRAGRPDGPSLLPPRVKLSCAVADCSDEVYSRELCEKHYRQVRRTGGIQEVRAAGSRPCTVAGCERSAEARTWCHGHYLRWVRSGSLLTDKPLRREEAKCCSVPECGRPHQSQGLCGTHYKRLLARGDAAPELPVRQTSGTGYYQRGYFIVPVDRQERWLVDDATSVAEHRLVMARALGRPLAPHESVHHRNGDRADNRLPNLELWSRYQPSGQRVEDKVAWAIAILAEYAPVHLAEVCPTEHELAEEAEEPDHTW
ncbi:MAG: hypothetical protein QOD70_1642 [Frankiales bacterium]|nr:hypothetical protein [Frankiales bacterium]